MTVLVLTCQLHTSRCHDGEFGINPQPTSLCYRTIWQARSLPGYTDQWRTRAPRTMKGRASMPPENEFRGCPCQLQCYNRPDLDLVDLSP